MMVLARLQQGDVFADRPSLGLQISQITLEAGKLFLAGLKTAIKLAWTPALSGWLPMPTTPGSLLAVVMITAHG